MNWIINLNLFYSDGYSEEMVKIYEKLLSKIKVKHHQQHSFWERCANIRMVKIFTRMYV